MKKLLSRCSLLTVAASILLSAGNAGATAMDAPWYVSLNAGMIRFEGDEAVQSGFLSSLRLGYDYSPAWTFEGVLNYAPRLNRNEVYNYDTGEPIPRKGLIDADHAAAFGAAVDALFHLRNMDNQQFDPYLISGIGFLHFTEEREFRERTDITFRAGVGMAYHFNREWALRGDFVMTLTAEHTEFNMLPTVGVSWRWGAHVPPSYSAISGPLDMDGFVIAPEDLALATSLYLEFDTDKWDIKPAYFEELNAIADVLLRDPGATARIEGHADKRRTSVYKHNMELSEKRANSVMEYLHSRGVERERMKAYGYGYTRPVAENDPIHGNQLNRRVEINIRKGSEAEQDDH